ncbi:MAG: terminase small subunit [Verrucomicrobiota bacterium]
MITPEQAESTQPDQLSLAGICAAAEAKNLSELPVGAGSLQPKQLKFVINLLRHGNQAQAYIEAGYNVSPDVARVKASQLVAKGNVQRFYHHCIEKLAANGNETVRRVMERATILHAKALRCAQLVEAEEDELVTLRKQRKTSNTTKGTFSEEIHERETRRDRAAKLERHYFGLANREDTLLASLLGKLKLNVAGTVTLEHVLKSDAPVNSDVMSELAQSRRADVNRLIGGSN